MYEYTRSKYPGGGGFAVQTYSLKFLYDQWLLRNNIWTKSNIHKDLCRYLSVKFDFYRHPETDFIIWYDRQPPFNLDKTTHMNFHPFMLLQRKNKIVLLSQTSNPKGKLKKSKKIRAPKQMLTKWFFTEQFCHYDLLMLSAAAASFKYPRIGCCNENRTMTLYCLNTKFYTDTDWAQRPTGSNYYKPYSTIATDLNFGLGTIIDQQNTTPQTK